jgi:hypothetical protein
VVVVSVDDIASVPGPGAYTGVCFFPVVVAGTACREPGPSDEDCDVALLVVEAKGRDGRSIRVGVMSVVRYNPGWQKAGPEGSNLAIAPPEFALAATEAPLK